MRSRLSCIKSSIYHRVSHCGKQEKDYLKFRTDGINGISSKEDIKILFNESNEVKATLDAYTQGLNNWWNLIVADFEALPEKKNVFELYRKFSESFTEALKVLPFGEDLGGAVLDNYQSRGSLAAYWSELNTDLKSVLFSALFHLTFICLSKSEVNKINFVVLGVPNYKSYVFTRKEE